MTLSLPDDFFDLYEEAADFFIEQFGVSCVLVYPPRRDACTNCGGGQPVGMTSNNILRHGSPGPFAFKCNLCGGSGYKEVEVTEDIKLRVYWSRKDWITVGNISIPNADAQIIGYLSELHKLRQSIEMKVTKRNEGEFRMSLASEPFPHGFGKKRYFIGFIKRAT